MIQCKTILLFKYANRRFSRYRLPIFFWKYCLKKGKFLFRLMIVLNWSGFLFLHGGSELTSISIHLIFRVNSFPDGICHFARKSLYYDNYGRSKRQRMLKSVYQFLLLSQCVQLCFKFELLVLQNRTMYLSDWTFQRVQMEVCLDGMEVDCPSVPTGSYQRL